MLTQLLSRKKVSTSLYIFGAHPQSYDFIYIDETSFNLQNWVRKGWAPVEQHPTSSNPPKSINYSGIFAMDLSGILSLKIVQGGVKGVDFFLFMTQLISAHENRFKTKKIILFLDNAIIHRSKDYMKKLNLHYNILYNALYTPQLNPIELAFGKIKHNVKKTRPRTEKQLLRAIQGACQDITEKNAAEYIIHSLKFLPKAIAKEDFY